MTIAPLAVSLGDPAGVGPELIAAAWAQHSAGPSPLPPFCVMGGAKVLAAAAQLRGLDVPIARVANIAQAAAVFANALPVIDLPCPEPDYIPGHPCLAGATLALASLTAATRAALDGSASGLVTGPIAKSRLALVGFDFAGQTEFVAHACGIAADEAVMMLAGPSLRTVPLTVHVPLSAVPQLVTPDLVIRRATIVAHALQRDFGLAAPRIAIAALNPHAGEDGRFGHEDQGVLAPAIAQLRAAGVDATGPHPADGLFAPRQRASFDVAICMYHDQALIPIKALDFDEGVNITLGLPIIRSSPDHGTAFGIAGKGLADAGATLAALRMAGACASRRAMAAREAHP